MGYVRTEFDLRNFRRRIKRNNLDLLNSRETIDLPQPALLSCMPLTTYLFGHLLKNWHNRMDHQLPVMLLF